MLDGPVSSPLPESSELSGRIPEWFCPRHETSLIAAPDTLFCPAGQHSVPVVAGIPRFVTESGYAEAFGLQWRRYRRTQLDSYTGTSISADRLRHALGDVLWDRLPGSVILECGCGAGRFTEVLLTEGAHVVSIDLSQAVDANAANFPVTAAHRAAQADILALPFARQQFDLVLALGVIQHTPSPERTMARLYDQVRPGGTLVFDHYAYSLAQLTKVSGLVRILTKRLPPSRGLDVTAWLVDALLPLHRRAKRLQPLLGRLSPVACYYTKYPQLTDQCQREWSLLDTHDSLTDRYKRLRTRGQIEQTLMRLEAKVIYCKKGGNGIEVRAMRASRDSLLASGHCGERSIEAHSA